MAKFRYDKARRTGAVLKRLLGYSSERMESLDPDNAKDAKTIVRLASILVPPKLGRPKLAHVVKQRARVIRDEGREIKKTQGEDAAIAFVRTTLKAEGRPLSAKTTKRMLE